MSNSPFSKKPHDLGLQYVPPASPTDPRVPSAEEFSLNSELTIGLFRISRESGWIKPPEIIVNTQNRLQINGVVALKIYPAAALEINTQIVLPTIGNTTSVIQRDDFLSIVGLAAVVGEAQDPLLGKVSFRYRDPVANTIQSIEKENARRFRSFWLIALSDKLITPAEILTNLTEEENGDRRLLILNQASTGFAFGSNRLFAMDANWASGLPYTIISDSIEVLPIAAVGRAINFQQEGYTYGYSQEEPISKFFIRSLANPLHKKDFQSLARSRLLEICQGVPGFGKAFKRTVKNLTAGQFAGNPGRFGESSGSPNGSVCLSNDQRISFSNEAVLQTLGVSVISSGNDSSGRALITVPLNTNAPSGSKFSENRTDHKIYTINGEEISSFGSFSNLGGSGALQWVAGENSKVLPGDRLYFVPAIKYPAGSGFNVPFYTIEKAWIGGIEILPANIRNGATADLTAYEAPVNDELYIIIYGSERAALHYIYKKIQVTTNSDGLAVIPASEKGCFAFIQGVSGRIDSPIKKRLPPNQSYAALCYYPPRSLESWQFQMLYADYQAEGKNQNTFLNGAIIVTLPLVFLHSSGGGLSVHQGDASLNSSLITMHLPERESAVAAYDLNTPIQFPGEVYPGPVTWRETNLISAPGLALPSPGQVLQIKNNSGGTFAKSLNIALQTNAQTLGIRAPMISSGKSYQIIITFVVNKDEQFRLVIVTYNAKGNKSSDVAFDSSLGAAMDVFYT